MKQVHTAALSRIQSPEFVTLYRVERTKLRTLSWVARLLYEELVSLSNFKTGEIATSYAQLLALLTPDQPAHGRRLAAPTLKQIRSAVDELQGADLVARNQALNEQAGKLLLHVESRESARLASANLGRDEGRVEKAKSFLKINKLDRTVHRSRAGVMAGGSGGYSSSIPLPQKNRDLSTGPMPEPPAADTPPGPIRVDAATPKIGPPRGADTRPAGAGHAPRATPVQAAMLARLAKTSSAPPGGQDDAPQAAKPASARLRRPKSLEDGGSAESGRPATPAGQGAEPTDGPRSHE